MPSSEIDNPHKLASPYEFFIVKQSPGAYHLDGEYTAFGEVIDGMEVVDKINEVKVDKRDMPISNIYIKTNIIIFKLFIIHYYDTYSASLHDCNCRIRKLYPRS